MNSNNINSAKPRVNVAVQWAVQADHPPFSEISNVQIRRWVRACFNDTASITLRFVGSMESRILNRDFRGKDKPTNVLTFPGDVSGMGLPSEQARKLPKFMADIVVCPEVLEIEAKEQHKQILHHLAHMIVHGCLHAQGFLHDDDEQQQTMETKEIEILHQFNIPNPYNL